MFGIARRKATAHATECTRPLVGILQHSQGLPPSFWQDAFVLGFIGFMIGFHGSVTSGRTLSQAAKGQLLQDTFTALSHLNGAALAARFTELATSYPKNEDYERGLDYASYCAFASIGKMTPDGQPHFEKAQLVAAAQGKGHDLAAVTAAMTQTLWFEELRMREAR